MSIPAICQDCGLIFTSQSISLHNTPHLTVYNSYETCPRRGGRARLQDGIYDFVGNVVSAFRNTTSDKIEAFQKLAKAAASGSISSAEAEEKSTEIHSSFGHLITLALQWGIPSLLVAIISLYLQWSAATSSDISSDAMMHELKAMQQTNEQILSEMQRFTSTQNTPSPQLYSQQTHSSSQDMHPAKTTERLNRHERRKAAAIAKLSKAPSR